MSRIRTSLDRHLGRAPAAPEDVAHLARTCWHQRGIAMLDPAKIADDWVRQALVNEAERQYGKRPDRGAGK